MNEFRHSTGFAVMIEDNLELPFETTVSGMSVTVQKVIQTDSGIVADCVRDGHHQRSPSLTYRCRSHRPRARSGSPLTGTERLAGEKYQGVKMSWAALDRIAGGKRHGHGRANRPGREDQTERPCSCGSGKKFQEVLR